MSITATLVIGVIAIIRAVAKKKLPYFLFYSLWGIVLIRLIFPFSFTSSLSLLRLTAPPTAYEGKVVTYISQESRSDNPIIQIGENLPGISESLNTALPEPTPMASANPMQIIGSVITIIWIIGMIFGGTMGIWSYLRVSKRLDKACLYEVGDLFALCKESVGIKRKVEIFQADSIESPIVFGILRPRILLPKYKIEEDALKGILLHELVHIKRGDYLLRPLYLIGVLIHWFNPFVWWSFLAARKDMELACDEKVLKLLDREECIGYAQTLLWIAQKQNHLSPLGQLAFGESSIKQRIKSAINFKQHSKLVLILTCLVGISLSIALLGNPKNNVVEIPKDPPEITVAYNYLLDSPVNLIILKNKWNGMIYDRASFYQTLWNSETAMTNLKRPKAGDKFVIDFRAYPPEDVSVKMEYITDSVIASELPTFDIPVLYDGTYYTFVHPEKIVTDVNTSGRFYAITARWGENECEYAFSVDGKFDVDVANAEAEEEIPGTYVYDHRTLGIKFLIPSNAVETLKIEEKNNVIYIMSNEVNETQPEGSLFGTLLRIEFYDKRYVSQESLSKKVEEYGLTLIGESADYYVGYAFPSDVQYPTDNEKLRKAYEGSMKVVVQMIPTIEVKIPYKDSSSFMLRQKELELYTRLVQGESISCLKDVEPMSIAKLYIQAGLDKNYNVQYELYTPYVETGWGWTSEEDHKIPNEDRTSPEETLRLMGNIAQGEFIMRGENNGYIRYKAVIEEGKEPVEMGFNMSKDKQGIWRVDFMPLQ